MTPTRALRHLLAHGLLLTVCTGTARAQVVRVRVVEEQSKARLPGALVSVRTASNQVVARTLADEFGRATLTLPGAGRYRIRGDRIGYEGAASDLLQVGASDTLDYQLVLPTRRVLLPELTVTSSRPVVCRLEREEGTVMAALWTEARKVLSATELTRSSRPPALELRTYDRRLDRSLRTVQESSSTRRSSTERPFVTIDPEELATKGYVQERDRETWYFAPDARLLLSDDFVKDHCFRVVRRDSTRGGLIGLAFEPSRDRRLPDVQGTLWLDSATVELRDLEFRYANVSLPPEAASSGGRLEFARLPNGTWIVSRWHIRMPVVGKILGARLFHGEPGGRDSLMGFRESGGEASVASGTDSGLRASAVLQGTVFDSSLGRPLEGVTVSLAEGAYTARTDSAGRFTLQTPAQGAYLVTLEHPRFHLLGLAPVLRSAEMERGQVARLDAHIPPMPALARLLCPALPADSLLGILVGRVAHSQDGEPVAGAVVRIEWTGFGLRQSGAQVTVSERGSRLEVTADQQGVYRACGVPREGVVELRVLAAGKTGSTITLRLTRPLIHELRLGAP